MSKAQGTAPDPGESLVIVKVALPASEYRRMNQLATALNLNSVGELVTIAARKQLGTRKNKGPARRYRNTDVAEMLRLLDAGCTLQTVATIFGCHSATVSRLTTEYRKNAA